MYSICYYSLWFSLFLILSCGERANEMPMEKADLIIYNTEIWTADKNNKKAQAVAIKGELFIAVGTNEDVLPYRDKHTVVIDAKSSFLYPGFIDCHVHFFTAGMGLKELKLRNAKSRAEFRAIIKDYLDTQEKGAWIIGGEWDHTQWNGKLPDKSWLDDLSSTHPIFLRRLDGHIGLANSIALAKAGIDKTSTIEGGIIDKDQQGNPTGIVRDQAMTLLTAVIAKPSEEDIAGGLQAAMNYVAERGISSVHQMAGLSPEGYIEVLKKGQAKGNLNTRITIYGQLGNWKKYATYLLNDSLQNEWVKVVGVKGFVDGSLGSHTALFHDHYRDKPDDKGTFITPPDSLNRWIEQADKAGLQIALHAIGDRAIDFALTNLAAIQARDRHKNQRFRIEHAQHIAPADIPRFAALNAIASVQPYHLMDDGRWANQVLDKKRLASSYAYRSLAEKGVKMAMGSDWFVAPPTPLEGIYAAVTRTTLDGKNPQGWFPHEKISVEQALYGYTLDAAYASFDENRKGSIEVGKLADIVFLDKNLFSIPVDSINKVKVISTYVGGRKVY